MPSPESLQQRIKWVSLPNGLSADGGELIFSVYVAPALTFDDIGGPATLAGFPDWLDWPATLSTIAFTVELHTENTVAARVLEDTRSSTIWQQLVPATTAIQPFSGDDLTRRPVMTFSAGTVVDSLRRSYAQTVVSAIDDLPVIAPPPQGLLPGDDTPFADIANALRDPANRFLVTPDEQVFADGFATLLADAQGTASDQTGMVEVIPQADGSGGEFVRAVAFHRGPATVPPTPDDPARLDALRASIDFHRTLTSLGEHPALLRQLGLVFDIAIPVSAIGEDRTGSARVVPQWESRMPLFALPMDSPFSEGPSIDRPLWVSWQLDPAAGLPFAALSVEPPGLLGIGFGSGFRVEHLAVDGAALHTVAMVSGLPSEGRRTAPPGLRSGGLTLLLDDRARAIHADFAAAGDTARGGDPGNALQAEDLTRGYRLDVFDHNRDAWFTLHARRVTYLHEGTPLLARVSDEGSHHPTAAGPHVEPGEEPPADAPVYLHESFVSWDGWSLSAPRPGRSLSVDPSGPDPDRPHTLPQRVTNDPLTQTGLQIEVGVQPGTLPRLRFGQTYTLRVRTVDLAGNGLSPAAADAQWERPFIAEGEEGAQLAASEFASAAVTFSRFEPVGPPALVKANPREDSAHQLVVRSGMDADVVPLVDTTDHDECQLFAPKGSVELAEWHGRFDDAIGSRDRARQRAAYELASRESTTLPAAGAEEIPYLPDPLAVGIAIADAPGQPAGITFRADWDAPTWDTPRPITIRLVPNELDFQPGPDFEEATRTVLIRLDPARRAHLRISSRIPANTPFGLLEWCEGSVDETTLQGLRRAVDHSRHCMFTPWEELEVVHAVQRPVVAPDLQEGEEVFRAPGATDYRFTGTLIPEPFSTSTLTLAARWTDWIDDPTVEMHPTAGGSPPWTRRVDATVGSITLPEPQQVEGVDPVFPRTGLYFEGSTMPPLQFSDTRHRVVTFTVAAASRFAELFPAQLGAGRLTRTGTPVECFVASTARPPVPIVSDVVPLLHRAVDADDPTIRTREGGWIRLYLERPWFATGEGEQLGLVVADAQPFGPQDPMYDLVSLVGTDLAHFSAFSSGLQTASITNATGGQTNVILPESHERSVFIEVTVLTFDPQFDEASQRWFADIRIDLPGTYFPMVRLALVRYQRNSIMGEAPLAFDHFTVSPVVVTEPVPLFPDRRLHVQTPVVFASDPPIVDDTYRINFEGATYSRIRSLDDTDDTSAAALASVTARAQRRSPVAVTGTGDDWETTGTFPFVRNEAAGRWEVSIPTSAILELHPENARLLVVEEDHVVYDPAVRQEATHAPRVVYADIIEGPFQTIRVDPGVPPDVPLPIGPVE